MKYFSCSSENIRYTIPSMFGRQILTLAQVSYYATYYDFEIEVYENDKLIKTVQSHGRTNLQQS